MQVTYLGHAAILLEAGGTRILMDPWLTDPTYHGTWWHFPPLEIPDPHLGSAAAGACYQPAVGQQRQARLADAAAHRAIFFPDQRRFGAQPLPHLARLAPRAPADVTHPAQRPMEVDRGGPRSAEAAHRVRDPIEKRGARQRARVAEPRHHPHRRRDADQRCPADLETANRLGRRLDGLEVALHQHLGEGTLVHNAHGAAWRPGDGLYAHGANVPTVTKGSN